MKTNTNLIEKYKLQTETQIIEFLTTALLISPEKMVQVGMIDKVEHAELAGLYCMMKLSEFHIAQKGYTVQSETLKYEADRFAEFLNQT